jgi:CheY-like chemotaxis protein
VEKPFVLLADDNEATCTLIQTMLQEEFIVEVARNGSEAIEKLKRRQYVAVLLDLLMPEVDGYEVLDFLAAERPAQIERVVIVTASVSPREMQRVKRYAVNGIVVKPFDVDILQKAVRRCTDCNQ